MSLNGLLISLGSAVLVPVSDEQLKTGVIAKAQFTDPLGFNWGLTVWDWSPLKPRVTISSVGPSMAEHYAVARLVALSTGYNVGFSYWPSGHSETWPRQAEVNANGTIDKGFSKLSVSGPKGKLP